MAAATDVQQRSIPDILREAGIPYDASLDTWQGRKSKNTNYWGPQADFLLFGESAMGLAELARRQVDPAASGRELEAKMGDFSLQYHDISRFSDVKVLGVRKEADPNRTSYSISLEAAGQGHTIEAILRRGQTSFDALTFEFRVDDRYLMKKEMMRYPYEPASQPTEPVSQSFASRSTKDDQIPKLGWVINNGIFAPIADAFAGWHRNSVAKAVNRQFEAYPLNVLLSEMGYQFSERHIEFKHSGREEHWCASPQVEVTKFAYDPDWSCLSVSNDCSVYWIPGGNFMLTQVRPGGSGSPKLDTLGYFNPDRKYSENIAFRPTTGDLLLHMAPKEYSSEKEAKKAIDRWHNHPDQSYFPPYSIYGLLKRGELTNFIGRGPLMMGAGKNYNISLTVHVAPREAFGNLADYPQKSLEAELQPNIALLKKMWNSI